MLRGLTGTYVESTTAGEVVRAFVPADLPPNPPIAWDETLRTAHEKALLQIGRLDGASNLLPEPHLFLYTYVRKEAVWSSRIEGTQSSLSDLLRHELADTPMALLDDVREVSRYVDALDFGIRAMREGMPLSLRLLRQIHERLLAEGRGAAQTPGRFRRSQNWIGGTRPGNAAFVPAPPHLLEERLYAWEQFLHNQPLTTPTLVKAALVHVQFETLHPFLDGNGRLGRLLITLLLCADGLLAEPMLYLSLYLRRHRSRYYALLQAVREEGDWEAWLAFFFEGVAETAEGAVAGIRALTALYKRDRLRLEGQTATAIRLYDHLQRAPVITAPKAQELLDVSAPTARKAIRDLEALGLLEEVTGGDYRRLYIYTEALVLLQQDTPGAQTD